MPAVTPLEPTTPIKPSEAIRLGCLIAPVQIFNDGYVDGAGGACGVGAGVLGMGWDASRHFGRFGRFEMLLDGLPPVCPVAGCEFEEGNIVHLNDDHRWSRERIADWLADQGL